MRIIFFLTISFLFFSCSKDKITKTKGTKLLVIEYTDDDRSWEENYFYNGNGKISSVEDNYAITRKYEITYENDKVKEFLTLRADDNTILFRDSIAYNNEGRISKIFNFSINSGENLPLTWIFEYEYDGSGKLSKKSSYLAKSGKYVRFEKYYWEGENIERVEDYNEAEELYYEYFYKYDNKVNYKKEIPILIQDPLNWSKNNITKMDWKDYYGNLDIFCNPCESTYKYNLDDYPVEITSNTGRVAKLIYE